MKCSRLIDYKDIEMTPPNGLEIVDGGILQKKPQNGLEWLAHFDETEVLVKEFVSEGYLIVVVGTIITPPLYPAGNSDFSKAFFIPGNAVALALGVVNLGYGFNNLHVSFYFWPGWLNTQNIELPLVSTYREFIDDNKSQMFKIGWNTGDIIFSAFPVSSPNDVSITAVDCLTADEWNFIECIIWEDTPGLRMKIKVNGDEKASGIMQGQYYLNPAQNRLLYILFDMIGNSIQRASMIDEVAIKTDISESVIASPRKVYTVGEIVSKWFGDSELDGVIWKPPTIELLGKDEPLESLDPLLDLDWRISAGATKLGVEFTGDKVDFNDLIEKDDVPGRWGGLEITYPGGETQYKLPAGAIDYDPPDVSEAYCMPEDVIHLTGITYADVGADNEDDLYVLLNQWIIQATDLINTFTNNEWTSVTVPEAVSGACARIVAGGAVIAQQRRKSPIFQVDAFNMKMIEDDVMTDDIKDVLQLYVKEGTVSDTMGIGVGITPYEDREEDNE